MTPKIKKQPTEFPFFFKAPLDRLLANGVAVATARRKSGALQWWLRLRAARCWRAGGSMPPAARAAPAGGFAPQIRAFCQGVLDARPHFLASFRACLRKSTAQFLAALASGCLCSEAPCVWFRGLRRLDLPPAALVFRLRLRLFGSEKKSRKTAGRRQGARQETEEAVSSPAHRLHGSAGRTATRHCLLPRATPAPPAAPARPRPLFYRSSCQHCSLLDAIAGICPLWLTLCPTTAVVGTRPLPAAFILAPMESLPVIIRGYVFLSPPFAKARRQSCHSVNWKARIGPALSTPAK